MRFNSEEERLELIESFKEKSKSLSKTLKKELPEDTEIIFETITEYDGISDLEVEEDNSEKEKSGNIYVCYIKQPHIMTAIMILDKINKRDLFSAGFTAWDAMVLPYPNSSKEIEQHKYKLGLVGRLGFFLEAAKVDIKKN